jgi:hypothetical protein
MTPSLTKGNTIKIIETVDELNIGVKGTGGMLTHLILVCNYQMVFIHKKSCLHSN